MSYHIYNTDGIVLAGADTGESNRYYHIFTRELGLVVAFAQGVRELKSKLRYHLSDFSYLSLSLVRGKDVWRVTNAETEPRFKKSLAHDGKRSLVATIAMFLKRFLHGEERNERLFNAVEDSFLFIEHEELDTEELKAAEMLFISRILSTLGYWGDASLEPILLAPLSRPLLAETYAARQRFLKEINRALKESHL